MENVSSKLKDTTLYVSLSGRISGANASAVQTAVDDAVAANPCTNLVFDMENLEYISSAGLRILLKERKRFAELEAINVNPEVYEILDMTGFTEMIEVKKAYRRLSVEGCEVIGEGANGRVYRLDPDTVVKSYFNPDALPEIQRERELARKAFILGIPTAIPYDVARVGDGYGSVFELLNAKSFAKLMQEEPENVDKYIQLSVDLLKLLHGTEAKPGDMPDMLTVAKDWAKFVVPFLPETVGSKLERMMQEIPVRYTVMHGDYHVKNLEMQNGEVLLIDMDTLCLGHPVFEFASIYNAYVGFMDIQGQHDGFCSFLGLPYDVCARIWERTVPLYLGTEDAALVEAVREKAMLIGYVRAMRRAIRRGAMDNETGRAQVEVCKKHIIELTEKLDSLEF